ncbi:uncharacterized protein LOC120348470 [Styela clava]
MNFKLTSFILIIAVINFEFGESLRRRRFCRCLWSRRRTWPRRPTIPVDAENENANKMKSMMNEEMADNDDQETKERMEHLDPDELRILRLREDDVDDNDEAEDFFDNLQED